MTFEFLAEQTAKLSDSAGGEHDLSLQSNDERNALLQAIIGYPCSSLETRLPLEGTAKKMAMAEAMRGGKLKMACLSILETSIEGNGNDKDARDGGDVEDDLQRMQRRNLALQGGFRTILLFVHGHTTPDLDMGRKVFELAKIMLKDGDADIQVWSDGRQGRIR